jgi:hypothetical protein
MKSIAISQPRFMPALNYFNRIALVDVFVYLDVVRYSKRDWENRNKIKLNSAPTWISAPVIKSNTEEIRYKQIDPLNKWREKHLSMIFHAYSKAPFYYKYIDEIKHLYYLKVETLMEFNLNFIDFFCKVLNINSQFINSSELGVSGTGQELLISICNKTGCNQYISGAEGRNYIDSNVWDEASIEVLYHDYEYQKYEQLGEEFVPWLSVLDLIFNQGDKSKEIILMGGSCARK